jgi:hypothetical protein
MTGCTHPPIFAFELRSLFRSTARGQDKSANPLPSGVRQFSKSFDIVRRSGRDFASPRKPWHILLAVGGVCRRFPFRFGQIHKSGYGPHSKCLARSDILPVAFRTRCKPLFRLTFSRPFSDWVRTFSRNPLAPCLPFCLTHSFWRSYASGPGSYQLVPVLE